MNSPKVAIIFAALLLPLCAEAKVVNLCANDTQTSANPADVNLSQALKAGGTITFACGGLATLRVNNCYTVDRDTDMDGGGKVTLDSNHRGCMFFGADNAPATLRIRSLRVINAGSRPKQPEPGAVGLGRIGSFIEGRFRAVELNVVSIEQSWSPVRLRTGSVRVLASSFTNNDEWVISGRNIEVLDHSRFINNRGLPLVSNDGTVVIDNAEFLSNTGPVVVSNTNPRAAIGSLKISHTNFSNNVAIGSGGALHLGVNATIEESEFHNNGALNGGAIYIRGNTSAVTMRMVKFGTNVAAQAGGAIAFENSSAKLEFNVAHAIFEDNRATYGGAISLERSFHNNLFFKGGAVSFVRNIASADGGAIFAPNASIQLSRGVFIENHAGAGGGAIAALQQGARVTALANSLLVRNEAAHGSAFSGNAANFINTTIADNDGVAVFPRNVPLGPLLPGAPASFPIKFSNTIVSGTWTTPCAPPTAATPFSDGGNNLQFPGQSCGATVATAFPFLGAYYVPVFWSPALNHGNPAICAAAPISRKDVYNVRRPLGQAACAIGAVEGDISHLRHRWKNERDDKRVVGP